MPNADEDGAAQLKRTLDQLAVTAAVIAEVPARTESPTDSPHQKWKATPGRALCALYMTRLC